MATVELEIPSRSAYVGVVRLALASLGRSAGMDEDRVDVLKMAVSEACANALFSHEQKGVQDPIEVSWTPQSRRVVIEVCDRGVVYDPDAVDPSDTQSLRLAMSVALLRSLVDGCEFVPRGDGGMCTRLEVNQSHEETM